MGLSLVLECLAIPCFVVIPGKPALFLKETKGVDGREGREDERQLEVEEGGETEVRVYCMRKD